MLTNALRSVVNKMKNFIKHCLKGFTTHLVSRSILQKSVRVNDGEIIDTPLIYSRDIAMQLTNPVMTVENVFKHDLAPIPTSIFNDDGDLRPAKPKADMKRILDGSAIL